MTTTLLRSLIICLLFICGHGQWLIAQSVAADGGRPRSATARRHTSDLHINSYIGTRQEKGTHVDVFASGLAKKKVYQFRSIDFPGWSSTMAQDFDDATAVGSANYGPDYFAFYFNGTQYQALNIPGAKNSVVNGINGAGQMVGTYLDSSGQYHGFFYNGKTVVTIDPPGSSQTEAWGINDSGEIVGTYVGDTQIGFLDKGGVFTDIDTGGDYTVATGINSNGDIVGFFGDDGNEGFLLSHGVYTGINFPESVQSWAYGINDAGAIAGSFWDGDFQAHGFTFIAGVFNQVDVPGDGAVTGLFRIKNNGSVVGYVEDLLFAYHGIIGH